MVEARWRTASANPAATGAEQRDAAAAGGGHRCDHCIKVGVRAAGGDPDAVLHHWLSMRPRRVVRPTMFSYLDISLTNVDTGVVDLRTLVNPMGLDPTIG
jgi:hypothetical protein